MTYRMSLQESLKGIRSLYSYMEIHTELMSMMKQEYDELNTFFGNQEVKMVRLVKKPMSDYTVKTQIQSDTQVQPPQEQQPPQPPQPQQQPQQPQPQQQTDSKQLKQWQKEQEQKKLAQLNSEGIDPTTLLTVENVRKWITEEGKTFAYVAREYLGIPEGKVADFGKKHNIRSSISKKRAVLAATTRVQQLRN